ncbi:hypothetical protein C8J57DRAFT_1519510 [Mycena rebaudengoi]|nr:hypothetical protein C8J57DRAFT_1519510 [Mycena rebaudengoi]
MTPDIRYNGLYAIKNLYIFFFLRTVCCTEGLDGNLPSLSSIIVYVRTRPYLCGLSLPAFPPAVQALQKRKNAPRSKGHGRHHKRDPGSDPSFNCPQFFEFNPTIRT